MRQLLFSLVAAAGLMTMAGPARAQEPPPPCPGPQPLLTVADFDGDGIVAQPDLDLMHRVLHWGGYLAYFDRNADYVLDPLDADATVHDLGATSTELDREIATVFWATVPLRDRDRAMERGWIPVTQPFPGHGVHWAKPADGRIDRAFELDRPEGLNYTPDGELVAVYFAHGPHIRPDAPPPEGFTGDEDMWHHHAGMCFGGVDLQAPTYDPTELQFMECLGLLECYRATGTQCTIWMPKMHMLHLWLYKLNPCGKFAMTHPGLGEPPPEGPPHCDINDIFP